MTVDIEKLEALAKAATPGPWECREAEGAAAICHERGWVADDFSEQTIIDTRYIAAANPAAVMELIAEVERLRDSHQQVCENYNKVSYASDERGGQIDQLRAEIAGLKTGYEAYERVNAELRAECEKLRKDSERVDFIDKNWFYNPYGEGVQFMFNELWEGEGREIRTAIDDAMSKEQSHD